MDSLRILPPVMPSLLLNAGGNYAEHSQGIAEQQQRAAPATARGRDGTGHLGAQGRRHA
jgi:hypothetical protein